MRITFYTTISKIKAGALEITGCSPNVSHLVIPSEIDGYPVISIAKTAFRNRQDLQSVELEEGIEVIGVESFEDCYQLKEVHLPDSLCRISTQAFQRCNSLEILEGSKNLQKIENSAFMDCKNLKTVHLKNNLMHLGSFAFAGCENLEDISMAHVPFYVGEDCFSRTEILCTDAYGLTTVQQKIVIGYRGDAAKVNLPEAAEVIAYGAFRDRYALQQVICSDRLKSIGSYAFSKCTQLRAVYQCKGLVRIYEYAFEQCTNLRILPASELVEQLGTYAFAACKSLQNLLIYPKLAELSAGVFSDCSQVEQVYFPRGLNHIYSRAFEHCESICKIQLPEELCTLDAYAFAGCSSLGEVYLPEQLKTMETEVFQNCQSLRSMTVKNWMYPMGFLGKGVCVTLFFPQSEQTAALFYSDDLARFCNGGRARLSLALYHAPQQIAFEEYDRCLELLVYEQDRILFVLNRLQYPAELSEEMEGSFREYLMEHAAKAVFWCAVWNEPERVQFLCENGFLTEDTLAEAITMVNEIQNLSVLSILMDHKKTSVGTAAIDSLFCI